MPQNTPDLKDWIDEIIEIASYECMLGRLQCEGNMGSFLATYKMCDEQDFLTTE